MSTRGTRVSPNRVDHTFPELLQAAGIVNTPGTRRQRVHDLRHSFTVATLLDWYRDNGDAAAQLPLLSTYLGHVHPESHLLVPAGHPGTVGPGRIPAGDTTGASVSRLPTLLQSFFTDRLTGPPVPPTPSPPTATPSNCFSASPPTPWGSNPQTWT